ncbi:UNVERIFIED_CONTAM: hypothetical protein K2H54_049415 [Gekko kuhli]
MVQVNKCKGWISSNDTLRKITKERAVQLSSVLRGIAESEKYANFDLFYMDYPLKERMSLLHSPKPFRVAA